MYGIRCKEIIFWELIVVAYDTLLQNTTASLIKIWEKFVIVCFSFFNTIGDSFIAKCVSYYKTLLLQNAKVIKKPNVCYKMCPSSVTWLIKIQN